MTPERWNKLKQIFADAVELHPDDRDAFIEQACAGDAEVLSEARRMVAAHGRDSGFLSSPALLRHRPQPDPRFSPGDLLAGRFRIVRFIARGGMGEVYEAADLALHEHVALKIIRPDYAADERSLALFKNEVQLSRRVTHVNVCRIYDLAEHAAPRDGERHTATLLSMELLRGPTLSAYLREHGPLPPAGAVPLIAQIAAALQAAHDGGIVHQDLKPGNIMLVAGARTDSMRAVVTDFGLARRTSGQQAGGSAGTGGTPAYAAPEQASGGEVTAAADVYSFALVIMEIIGAWRPAPGASLYTESSGKAARTALAAPQSNLPPGWAGILQRCLSADPAQRYSTPAEVAAALSEALHSPPRRFRPFAGATNRLVATAAIASLPLLAVLIWAITSREQSPTAPPAAIVPLTTYAGTEVSPTFSPDGTKVAFAWNRDIPDSFDVYEKQVRSGGAPVRLTANPARWIAPSWSPDGRTIALIRALPDLAWSVSVIPASGGPERRLAEIRAGYFASLAWTPDSKWIIAPHRPPRSEAVKLYLISAQTGELRPLTNPSLIGDYSGAVSPDGTLLGLGHIPAPAVSEIDLVPISSNWRLSTPTRLIDTGSCCVPGIMWMPDSRSFLYMKLRYDSATLLRASSVTGWKPAPVSTVGQLGSGGIALSPRGDELAYSDFRRGSSIWRLDLSTTQAQPQQYLSSAGHERGPSISPDGKRVAFASSRLGPGDIWLADAGGSHERQLTSLGSGGAPQWSPDGSEIAFDAAVNGNLDVYVVPVSGGPVRRVTDSPASDALPTWSTDGKSLYFKSDRTGRSEVWKLQRRGGPPAVQVTRNGGWLVQESIDGARLYVAKGYASNGENASIWEMPAGGGEERLVVQDLNNVRNFAVVRDGIYFERDLSPRMFRVLFYSFTTRRTKQIATVQKTSYEGLSISPDLRWLLFSSRDEQGGDMWLVENFR